MSGGSPRLQSCQVLFSGSAVGATTSFVGINVSGLVTESPTIAGCRIHASGLDGFTAIAIMSSPANVSANTISMDTMTGDVLGIRVNTANAVIRNNLVETVTESSSVGEGIYCTFASPLIQNNTFVYTCYGILAVMRSRPVVENDLFLQRATSTAVGLGAAYCEWTDDSAPLRFRNNHTAYVNPDLAPVPSSFWLYVDWPRSLGYETDVAGLEATLIAANTRSRK